MSSIISKLINLAGNITGTLGVANGGTGLTGGTSGGVPYYSSSSAITSSGALAQYGVVLGGGAGATPATLAAVAGTGQFLRSAGASANPVYSWTSIGAKSADYVITDTDGFDAIYMTTSSSNRTVTLPAAANNTGRMITIKKVDSGTGTVAISGTIDGGTTNNTIKAQYGVGTVVSDGSAWYWVSDIQESGSFTPVLKEGVNTLTCAVNAGIYTRNGRAVTIQIELANITKSGTGALTITSLPFAAKSGLQSTLVGSLNRFTNAASTAGDAYFAIAASASIVDIYWFKTGDFNGVLTIASDIANASQSDINAGGTYIIAS